MKLKKTTSSTSFLYLFLVLCTAVLTAAEPKSPAKVTREDILFLAHFNTSLSPEIGCADTVHGNAKLTSNQRGFAFKNSINGNEALNAALNNASAIYPFKDNMDIDEGTLQMLVKPQWKAADYAHCVFFMLLFDDKQGNIFCGTHSLTLQKIPKEQKLCANQDGNQTGIYSPVPSSEWLQLTMTWSVSDSKLKFYVNGEFQGEKRYTRMIHTPTGFTLGHPKTWNAQALIDEVRILQRPLTADEVKADYQYLMAGNEFTNGETATRKPLDFEPVPVPDTPIGLVSTLLPITFHCPRTTSPVKLDGVPDEADWKQAPPITELTAPGNPSKLPPPTEIRLLHDDKAFYISAVMHHTDMATHVAQYDQNDLAIYNDECLEFFLDITNKNDDFLQFCVNSLGSIYDSKGGDKAWNAIGAKAVGARQEKSWSVEMRIPFSAVNRPAPLPGEIWGARLCREHHQGTPAVSIPCRNQGYGFDQRHSLGRLVFTLGAESSTAAALGSETFGLGYNTVTVKPTGNWPAKTAITIICQGDDSIHLAETTAVAEVKPEFALPVIVTDDRVATVTLQFFTEDGKTLLASSAMHRNFRLAAPGYTAIRRELQRLDASLDPVRDMQHPVTIGAQQAVKRMMEQSTQFEEALKTAVEQKKTLPAETVNDAEALLNGFLKNREKNLFLVWETSPWEIGTPQAIPPKDYRRLKSLDFQQASNEREARTIILSGLYTGPRMDARVIVRAIDYGKNCWIPESCFEIHQEPFLNVMGSKITGPLLEIPGSVITLTPGEPIRLRITFNSRGVKPGHYRTSLIIKPLNDFSLPSVTIGMNLHVWNFTLPETHDWPIDCFLWGPNTYENDEAAMLRLMHSRHINHGWTKSHLYTDGIFADRYSKKPENAPFNIDATINANETFFRTAQELKMKFVYGWGTTDSYEWHKAMSDRLHKMGFTNGDFVFHGLLSDEFLKANIPQQEHIRAGFTAKGAPWTFMATYLSTPPPSGATLDDIREANLPAFFKLWCPISSLFNDETRGKQVAQFFKSFNCRIWPYRCSTSMLTQPYVAYYRSLPWLAWNFKLDGCAFWTNFSPRYGNQDCFDFRDGGAADGITLMDTHRRPIPTKHLEALCEGLEDVAYANELTRRIQAHPELPETTRKELMALATDDLNAIRLHPDQNAINQWRLRTGKAIDSLGKTAK